MRYALTLKKGDSDKIVIETKDNDGRIASVEFSVAQTNATVEDHTNSLEGDVVIRGFIHEETKDLTSQLFQWSLATQTKDIYRSLLIEIYKDDDDITVFRKVSMDEMFCVSYQESYEEKNDNSGADGSKGRFILKMRQKKGQIKTIEPSSK